MEKSLGGLAKKQTQAIAWNIPNLLSVFRILTVPFVVVCLFYPSPAASFLAALIFGIASITDLLDGYIARYQKSETAIGQLLDPLADKLLINSALIMLIPLGRIPAWMVVLNVAREVAVTGLRGIASIVVSSELEELRLPITSFITYLFIFIQIEQRFVLTCISVD